MRIIVSVLAVVFSAACNDVVVAQEVSTVRARQVLLLHAYGSPGFRTAFDAALAAAGDEASTRPAVHSESIDVERRWPDTQSRALVQFLADKYAKRPIDVLVTVGDAALPLARELSAKLGGPPIVACVIAGGTLPSAADNGTGIDATVALRATIELSLALRPQTRRVYIVDGTPQNSGDVEAEYRRQTHDLALEQVYLRDLALGDVVARLSAAPDDSVVLFVRQRLLDATHDISGLEGLARVVAASPVPVFSINENHLGRGVVGGVMWRIDELARRTAAMTQRLAEGGLVRDVAPEKLVGRAIVDWTQLQRWRLAEAGLPPDAVVLDRPQSPFEQYRLHLTIGAIVSAGLLALVVGLLIERKWRRTAERDVQHLRNDLAHLGRLSAMGELTASLAHELSQPLTSILSNAQAAKRLLGRGAITPPTLHAILDDIVMSDKRAGEVIARVRDLVKKRAIQRTRVDLNDVVQAVAKLVTTDSMIREVSISVALGPEPLEVDGDRVQLQQVALNLLLNAIEAAGTHAGGPHRATISTTASDRDLAHIVVRDTGPGLQPGTEAQVFAPFYTTKETGMGMGLAIASSIVEAHGGRIWAARGIEGGAEFHVTVPRLSDKSG
jgi:signal transduction histidine kinase